MYAALAGATVRFGAVRCGPGAPARLKLLPAAGPLFAALAARNAREQGLL
jgi:hypothetical protein